jgi:hypothetical protein
MSTESSSNVARRTGFAIRVAVTVLALVAACSESQQGPAEQAIAEVEAVVVAAGTAPARYIPGELKDVQSSVAELKRDFERRDYDAVVSAAPAVLSAARALGPSAAAREAELTTVLRDEWSELVAAVPTELTAIAGRFDRVATRRTPPAGVTAAELTAAKDRLRDALALWDRALQEAEAGRLPEAVTLAHQVREMGQAVDAVSQAGAARAPVE